MNLHNTVQTVILVMIFYVDNIVLEMISKRRNKPTTFFQRLANGCNGLIPNSVSSNKQINDET